MRICWARTIPVLWYSGLLLSGLCLDAQSLAELGRAYRTSPTEATRAALLQYASRHENASGALAYLALGSTEIEQRQFPEALHHLESAAKRLRALADYTAYLGAVSRFELGKYTEVDHALKPVWEQIPSSPLEEKAVVMLANALLANNEPAKVVALVQKHQASLTTPEAEILLAHAYLAQNDTAAALTHFERILTDFPLSNEAADAGSDPARIAALDPKAHLTRCVKLVDGTAYQTARQELEPLIDRLSGADREMAELKLGEARYLLRDSKAAYDYLSGLSLSSPELEAERLYYLVRCASRLDRPGDFQPFLDRLALNFSKSRWRLKALQIAADYFWLQNDVQAYQPIYLVCAESFPLDPGSAECRWRYAFSEYRLQHADAAELFQQLLKRFPDSTKTPSALYFLGRSAEKKLDNSAARAWYDEIVTLFPNSFYAVLAREKLNEPSLAGAGPALVTVAFLRSIPFAVHDRTWNFVPTATTRLRNERARLLASAGLDDLAESELRYGAKSGGQPELAALALAELAEQRQAPDVGIRYIKQLAPNYLRFQIEANTEKFWKLAFPMPYRNFLDQYSRERQLDPFLVAALIRQESEFDPKVISRAHAYGLTQILPSTGREISRKLSLRGFRADMLFTPGVNLNIGTYFLRTLLDRLQGNWEATLASYNAGPARVAKWLSWGEFAEPAEFIETIPFDETRDYVMGVLRNADLYRRLYGAKTVALASSDGHIGRKDASSAAGDRKPAATVP